FFFSSRRRHTRSLRDWSSDVCSSDLGQKMSKTRGNVVEPWELIREFGADGARLYLLASSEVWKPKRFDRAAIPEVAGAFLLTLRSEERRVGEECESRWSTCACKRNKV